MKKRMLSILMALAMMLSLLPVSALAVVTTECAGDETCTHQAAIGNTHYDTLTEALSAAADGQTVTLLKDIDNSVTSPEYKNGVNYSLKAGTTLDGDGHTISGHIGVYIPAAGATVQNVKFVNIHNTTEVDKDTCDYYGWESKTGNQSAIYASKLTGTATITGCTFDNIDWDAIQITPAATSAEIVITGNVFRHTATDSTQLRYVHVEHTLAIFSGSKISELTITDNQFYDTEAPNTSICSIGVWYVNRSTTTLKVDGNYIETPTTAEVDKLTVKALYPMRSQANVDVDDITPVAYYGSEVYFSLQEAIDEAKTYVYLMDDAKTDAVISTDKKISFYPYGYDIGTLTNNGELTIYGADCSSPSKIINNGALTLGGNAATVYGIENNGTLKITSGTTYDLSKITGSGTVTITGGTFSTKPSEGQLAKWYTAKEQDDQTYKVSKMTVSEALPYGLVASGSRSGGNYYSSVSEGMNTLTTSYTYLQVDSSEDVVINTQKDGMRYFDTNGHSFNGTLAMVEGSGEIRLCGSNFDLKNVTGELLSVGTYNMKAKVSIENADLDKLNVSASGDCTVAGGQYQDVVVNIYYAKKADTEPKYTAVLSITGGSFASDKVTVDYANHTLENGSDLEEVPLSNYVPAGYTVVEGTGAYPYQVVKASDTAAEVVPAAPSVSAPEGADDLKAALEAAEDLVTGSGLDVAAGTKANENTLTAASEEVTGALETEGIDTTEKTVTIVIQPYMDVEIKEVSTEADNKTLILDITPKYNVVATTATLTGEQPEEIEIGKNAAIVKAAQELTITQPVTVTIPLPAGFVTDNGANIYVKHTKNGDFVAYHTATYAAGEDSTPATLTFTNDKGFSTFEVVVDERSAQVQFGADATATTLTPADVNSALPKAAAPAGQVFGGWTFEGIEGTYTSLTDDLLTKLAEKSGTITATAYFYTPSTGSTTYAITVKDGDNGTVTASRTRANKGLTVTLTVKADEGYKLDTITVTDKNGNEIKLTDKGDGKYTFAMPASAVTVKASFAKDDTPVETGLPFTDVKADDWFYEAVKYAYDNKLMDGTSSTTFAPLMTTNRAMIVTILWRLEGSPVVNYAMNFSDVESGVWYTEAVRWAAAEGIVKGYSDTVFAPDDTVTREQLATILYRYAECKEYDVSAKGDLTTFADGSTVSTWAADGMTWAVGAQLITGKDGGKLDPTGTATRAEVATILMRFCENVAK